MPGAWLDMSRTGVARTALPRGEGLQEKNEAQVGVIKRRPKFVRSFSRVPNVGRVADWRVAN